MKKRSRKIQEKSDFTWFKKMWCPRGACSDFAHRAFMLLDNLVIRWVAVNIWFIFTHIKSLN